MIISHKYKYLFIELPHTASSAISKELREFYDGSKILRKHAFYHDFLKIANAEEKKYFVFAGIRHPADEVVSLYLKYKNNHREAFTNSAKWKENGGFIKETDLHVFNFIQKTNAEFPVFFKKYYQWPYDNWSSLAHKKFDYVIHFESLQEDFAAVLKLLNIEQARPLPVVNKTQEKADSFWSYYTPEIREQATQVFGPFMEKWGYTFPYDWGAYKVSQRDRLKYQFISALKKLKWRYRE
jgi:hypothetical protein